MISPLVSTVRCDWSTAKDERCKSSFIVTLASFAAAPDEVVETAKRTALGWYIDAHGRAFCPACVTAVLREIERREAASGEAGGK